MPIVNPYSFEGAKYSTNKKEDSFNSTLMIVFIILIVYVILK